MVSEGLLEDDGVLFEKDFMTYFEGCSLTEIMSISDFSLRRKGLSFYQEFLNTFPKNYLTAPLLASGRSIHDILESCQEFQDKNGDFVAFYPGIKEVKAKSGRLCQISGGIISLGSSYYTYRPFFENLHTGKKYILKNTIHAELSYYDFFPKNIQEFETLAFYLENPSFAPDDGIDYYFLGQQIGETLPLLEVKSNHEKQKIRRKLRQMKKK